METITPTDEYGHGQMMGMLVIIELIETIAEAGATLDPSVLEKIKRIAVSDLAQYLNKPEEDVHLLVETKLKDI